MKKLMFVAIFGMALGLTSCGSDDVKDFVCDTVEEELRADVEAAITAWQAEENPDTCAELRGAIEAYRASECGNENAYAQERETLPDDCSTAGSR